VTGSRVAVDVKASSTLYLVAPSLGDNTQRLQVVWGCSTSKLRDYLPRDWSLSFGTYRKNVGVEPCNESLRDLSGGNAERIPNG